MKEIVIRPMFKKELAAICDTTMYDIRLRFAAMEKKLGKASTGEWKGRIKLSKETVRLFLKHNDIIPEEIKPINT